MNAQTLAAIKREIRKVAKIYDILIEHWNGDLVNGRKATYPITVTAGVIINNMAFDSSDCHGYNHDEAVRKLKADLEVLRKLNEYNEHCYMTHFPFTDIDSIISGLEMTEHFESVEW